MDTDKRKLWRSFASFVWQRTPRALTQDRRQHLDSLAQMVTSSSNPAGPF